jgi:general secretion pathway protein A
MYNQFFGLRRDPFSLTPDPEFLYLTPQHREALAGFTYAILARKGFVVLTGNAGTGKTTLLGRVLQHLPVSRVRTSVIVNPTLTASEFLEAVMLDFGLTDIPVSKAQRIARLQTFLSRGRKKGKISALIIDEAHQLSMEVLEEIRLLGNFESASEKLLQIALLGQSELDDLLDRDNLKQFKQRIALRVAIEPLSPSEIPEYVQHRWTTAGGAAPPFSPEAFAGICQASQGVPRVINVICDNALIQACGEGSASVEARHMFGACQDLRIIIDAPRTVIMDAPQCPLAVETPFPFEDYSMKTLERYGGGAPQPSSSVVVKVKMSPFVARLASKLRLLPRTETA